MKSLLFFLLLSVAAGMSAGTSGAQPSSPPPPLALGGTPETTEETFNAFVEKLDRYYDLENTCDSISNTEQNSDIKAGCTRLLNTLKEEILLLWKRLQAPEEAQSVLP